MHLKNSPTRFGIIAIVFHWGMALILIGMLCLGLYMVRLPIGLEKLKLYGLHKAIGILVLILVSLRLLWRLYNQVPRLSILPIWEKLAARAMHWALYVLMFFMPLSGWLMTSAAGFPPSFFGLFTLPLLIEPNKALLPIFGLIHEYLAYGLIAAILVHTAAAFKHHFIDKDDILKRMIS